MPHLSLPSAKTYYQKIGNGPHHLLLLHGWGRSWDDWSSWVAELSADYTLWLVDLPGFGKSESPSRGWKMQQYVTWLHEFLRDQKITSLYGVLGHSFGGKLATFVWLTEHGTEFPRPTTGLLLVSPSSLSPKLPFGRRILATILSLIPKIIKRGLLRPIRRWLYTSLLGEMDYLNATPFQEETLNHILREEVRQLPMTGEHIPVHLFWGENDTEVPLRLAYELQRLHSATDVCVLPTAGHFAHHQHPDTFTAWFTTWLQEQL